MLTDEKEADWESSELIGKNVVEASSEILKELFGLSELFSEAPMDRLWLLRLRWLVVRLTLLLPKRWPSDGV